MMMHPESATGSLPEPDQPTRLLIRLAAAIAAGTEVQLRAVLRDCAGVVETVKVEEIILQSYLFCGFPRALNAAREWRRLGFAAAPVRDSAAVPAEARRREGERTCAIVYGDAYGKLRENIRALHPALDDWMVDEGYGKVLSRGGLDLKSRELCIVAACAASRQERQLHSHLHGALNAGASGREVDGAFDCLQGILESEALSRARMLWGRVKSGRGEDH